MTQPETRSPLRKIVVVVLSLAAVALGGLLILGAVMNAKKQTVTVNVTLNDSQGGWSQDAPCAGTGGYSDMTAGTAITMKNGDGQVIATGVLPGGVADDATTCTFTASVKNVPRADFYAVSVGGRGEVTSSRSDLEKNAWSFDLTLGSAG